MEWLFDYTIWASFLSLTALEIVLGIDNIVFLALVVQHLKKTDRQRARVIGLSLAMALRVIFLLSLAWIIGLKEPLVSIAGVQFSGKDILMLVGGLFLLSKATSSIHDAVTGELQGASKQYAGAFFSTIVQVILVDVVFSFDSVMTAIGLTHHVPIIIAAMLVSVVVMLIASASVSDFIDKHPTLKMLALSFVMMIGVLLVADGFGFSIPKGYIYFGMAFSLGVEALNMLVRKKKSVRKKA
jgi:predicted tellurium resistance membrane protein TerC